MDLPEPISPLPAEPFEQAADEPGPPMRARRRLPLLAPHPLVVPGVLFALTLLTTTLANGLAYALALLAILLVHEMGHYMTCRVYRIPSTLPYFLPLPPQISFLGTLGAVIRMRLRTGQRKVLFDIGIAGPIAGVIVAIPVAIWGLAHSRVLPGNGLAPGIQLGESLLFRLLERAVLGPLGPTDVVVLHPVALAGWTGLFVTGLNLIPAGMLDGGHVLYGLLGAKSRWVAFPVVGALVVLAITQFPGWWIWVGLLLLLGVTHPAVRLPGGTISRGRVLLGILALAVFVACFVPRPISLAP